MASTVVRDYERTHAGRYVENVTIVKTDDDTYPCGWKYTLHYGEIGGRTLLRYDNAYELTKGHERHALEETEIIEFPGMEELYRRFQGELDELPP